MQAKNIIGVIELRKMIFGVTLGIVISAIIMASGIALALGNINIIVDGKKVNTDVAPQIIDGRVMVPIRFIASALGANVAWNSQNRTVNITSMYKASRGNGKFLVVGSKSMELADHMEKMTGQTYFELNPILKALGATKGSSDNEMVINGNTEKLILDKVEVNGNEYVLMAGQGLQHMTFWITDQVLVLKIY